MAELDLVPAWREYASWEAAEEENKSMSLTAAGFVLCTAIGAIELTSFNLGVCDIAISADPTLGCWERVNGEVEVRLDDGRKFRGKEEFIADLSNPYVCGEFGKFPPFYKIPTDIPPNPSTDSS